MELQALLGPLQPDQMERAMPGAGLRVPDLAAQIEHVRRARRLITSLQQQFVSLRRGAPGPLPPPVDNKDELWSPLERMGVEEALAYSVVGARDPSSRGLKHSSPRPVQRIDVDGANLRPHGETPLFRDRGRIRRRINAR